MSIRIMTAVWELDLPDSDKLVLLALADNANDEGQCWPSIATLARKCSKDQRTVERVLKRLREAGHVDRRERPGTSNIWVVTPRHDAAPSPCRPPHDAAPPPVTVPPKPSLNRQPLSESRARHIDRPDDVSPQTWTDVLRLRDKQKAVMSHTALKGIKREADKAGWTLERALEECCERNWRGFKAEWVGKDERNGQRNGQSRTGYGRTGDAIADFLREAEGGYPSGSG